MSFQIRTALVMIYIIFLDITSCGSLKFSERLRAIRNLNIYFFIFLLFFILFSYFSKGTA
jgi:hypothetical protein